MSERARLTDALALAARPRAKEYAIHDTALQGFMLRVQPSGARAWVFRFRRAGTPRRVTLGKPEAVKAERARAAALAFLARETGGGEPVPLPASGPTLRAFAAEYVERRAPAWKPSTVTATLSYLDCAILPTLGHLRVGAIVRADIARFFHEYGRRKPGGANRAHDILRNLFDCAIAWGRRAEAAGNPCKGIVRYRRPPRGRLLGAEDLAKLGAVLRRRENDDPVCVAAVRLILLTGCRPGEIRRLRRCEVRPDRLTLTDSKTGPRHVLHVAGRLLGHRRASTTNRYVHLDDATLGEAAERVAAAIARKVRRDGGADPQAPGRL